MLPKNLIKVFHLVSSLSLLSGCAQMGTTIAQVGRPLSEHGTFTDTSWAASQKNANIQAVVAQDEEYSSFRLSQLDVVAGVSSSEKVYRRVILFMTHSEGGTPFLGYKGYMRFVAIIPDGMPLLKTGDLVEARVGNVYDGLKGFAQSGEGTAVLRMLCPANDSRSQQDKFKSCAQQLPWLATWGESHRFYEGIVAVQSGRAYRKALKDHDELTFTQYYSSEGVPLPSAIRPATRPTIETWVLAKPAEM